MGALTPSVALRRMTIAGRQMATAFVLTDPRDSEQVRSMFDRAVDRRADLADAVAVLGEADALAAFAASLADAWDPEAPRLAAPPPGRPPAGEVREARQRLPVDVTVSLLRDITDAAAAAGVSRQAWVEAVLRRAVAD
jgi:hypothetical protein